MKKGVGGGRVGANLIIFVYYILITMKIALRLQGRSVLPVVRGMISGAATALITSAIGAGGPIIGESFGVSNSLGSARKGNITNIVIDSNFGYIGASSQKECGVGQSDLTHFVCFSIPTRFRIPARSTASHATYFCGTISGGGGVCSFALEQLPNNGRADCGVVIVNSPRVAGTCDPCCASPSSGPVGGDSMREFAARAVTSVGRAVGDLPTKAPMCKLDVNSSIRCCNNCGTGLRHRVHRTLNSSRVHLFSMVNGRSRSKGTLCHEG